MTQTTISSTIITPVRFLLSLHCIDITSAVATDQVGRQVEAQAFHGAAVDPSSERATTESLSELYVS